MIGTLLTLGGMLAAVAAVPVTIAFASSMHAARRAPAR